MPTARKPKPPKPPKAKVPRTTPEPEATPGVARRWEFSVPNWVPTPLNKLLSVHWAAAGRMKKLDRRLIGIYSRKAGVPEATTKRRVSLRITLPKGGRRYDPDALFKSLLDGCVKEKLLVNDSPVWCELGPVDYERGEVLSTTVIIEEV